MARPAQYFISRPAFFTALVCAFLVLSAVLAAGTASATEFSVYRGPGCDGRKRIASFEAFAGRKVERVVDSLNEESWARLQESIPWVISCWKGAGLKLTLSVPMLPFDHDGTLAEGASGRFDDVFQRTGEQLVANGFKDAVVRIGWEFNGDWMPWRADVDPAAYARYFQRIVTVMRKVPGQAFKFEWTPNHGRHNVDPSLAYPGDGYVDVIGMDVYDEIWNEGVRDPVVRWAYYRDQPFGLAWHRDFSAEHHKPMSYPEWGVGQRPDQHGSGDDPYFVAQMAAWIKATKPLYASYWDDPSPTYDAELSTGRYPKAAAEFKRAFSTSAKL